MTTKKSNVYSLARLEQKTLGSSLSCGDAIRSLRELNAVSQVLLAKKLKVSKQYICDLEKCRRSVSISQAIRIANIFKYPLAVLVQLTIQDQVRENGLDFEVKIENRKKLA